jgi:L1 cell adhesion molecule like protein
MAENSLGVKCERAVLTVPDTLVNDWISEAAKAAGFIKSTRLIDQSMAALFGQFAATYATPASVDKQAASSHSSNADSNFLIIDCGASSVKLSLIARRSGVYLRLSHKYLVDGVCTGEAVDAILFDYFRNEFQRKTRSELTNRRSKAKLWLACEQLKKTLSKSANAFISVDSLQDGMDFHSSLHQLKFESLINPLLSRLASEIEEFLGRPVVGGAQAVDQVVLVGGMARLPKIEQLVRFFFPQFTPAASGGAAAVDPQEVFALGAACEVPYLDKGGCDETTVTGLPFTIGIRVHSTAEDGNQVSEVKPVVHKHHPLPLKQVFELEVLRSEALLQLVNSSSGGELIEEFYLDGIDPENPTVQCVLTVSTEGVVALDFSQD